jgi:CPA2 family monovalent cation:H+ antiporter-2
LIVGYLLAGFILGPNVSIFPSVSETTGIQIWGEIGVLFLLFSLGLEFSFKKLLQLGPSSLVAASVEVIGLFALGLIAARGFGWGQTESLFVGGMVAISSTAILLRAVEETGTKSARFTSHVFGILIVEDLYAILMLVVLATLSSGRQAALSVSGTETFFFALVKFGFFLTIFFVVGITLLPGLIRRSQRYLSDEMRVVLSLGFCFMTVVVAARVGFSPALGAFVTGSLLAGTREAKRIEELLLPVRHLFASIFFISVGMKIDPSVLLRYPGEVSMILAVVLVGKPVFVTIGLVLTGKPLRVAIRSGVSMAQIGEFSFIIAALGTSLGLVRPEIGAIVVMVATVTALTTPYAVKYSKRIAQGIEALFPQRFREALERYDAALQRSGGAGETRRFIRGQAMIILVNSALIGALGLFFERVVSEFLSRKLGDRFSIPLAGFVLAAIAAAPFFWGLAKSGLREPEVGKIWTSDQSRPLLMAIMIFRAIVFIAMGAFLASRFLKFKAAYMLSGSILSIGLLLFSKRVERVYERFAQRFLMSLSDDGYGDGKIRRRTSRPANPVLAPWDGHIAVFDVSIDSLAAGRTLLELQIRERYGVTVTLIERGDRKLPAPPAKERIFPRDRIHVIGSDEELAAFREFIEVAPAAEIEETTEASYSLQPVSIAADSPFVGRTIRETDVRERARGLVVGVERQGKRILNPSADFRILTGDLLWIVGETEKIRALETLAPEVLRPA